MLEQTVKNADKMIKNLYGYKVVHYLGNTGTTDFYTAETYEGKFVYLKINIATEFLYKKTFDQYQRIRKLPRQ